MDTIKNLSFSEKSGFNDLFTINGRGEIKLKHSFLRGHVVFRDEEGNILLEKDNMIVLRGRTYALEKLFGSTIDASSGYIQNLSRSIALFRIGDGGANVETNPFAPYVPGFNDTSLGHEVPFITIDPSKNLSTEKAANPSIFTTISTTDANKYFDIRTDVNDANVKYYYAKTFDAAPEWSLDKVNNEVYKKITLRIGTQDARNQYINEIGLCIAAYDSVGPTYTNIELFSRICFDSESLTNLTKQILIDYYIYA